MYKNSIIYEIVCQTTGDRYIGSTYRKLKDRVRQHKELRYSSKQIIETNNYKASVLEPYPCNNKYQLRQQEQSWMDRLDCINQNKAWRLNNQKEWLSENKEYVKQWHKENYLKRRERHLRLGKIWVENNRDYKRKYHKMLYDYKCSWGEMAWGHPLDNNLLKIDITIFN
tara:strand:- start:43 stop:549 length:507 start_codon:yes stop_codon:yes gene_type:complete